MIYTNYLIRKVKKPLYYRFQFDILTNFMNTDFQIDI